MVSSKPEIEKFTIEEDDAFLIIASDGLWDYVLPEHYVEIVKDSFSKNENLNDVCQALVEAALQEGSEDDITVLVVSLNDKIEKK